MTMQGEAFGEGEYVAVRRPGLVRLADTAIRAGNATARNRVRGETMIKLVAAAGAWGATIEISSEEPDGARWSVRTRAEESAR